jgi:small-conductance mechanosensitive channel
MAAMPDTGLFAGLPAWVEPTSLVALIVLIAVGAHLLLRAAVHTAADRLIERNQAGGAEVLPDAELQKRVRTLEALATRLTAAILMVIAGLTVLGVFNVNVGPAIAGIGVIGIAVGLGAQTLVKDWLAGIFIILENQFSEGDIVSAAGVAGVVEDFSLRRTALRDLDGTLHTVPNGLITVASNLTRGWARVNLDVSVAYDTDIERATAVLNRIGQELLADETWGPKLLEPPSVARVNALTDSSVDIKVLGQVRPAEQWGVAGELRRRILAAFAANDIEIPFPHRVVINRPAGAAPAATSTPARTPARRMRARATETAQGTGHKPQGGRSALVDVPEDKD